MNFKRKLSALAGVVVVAGSVALAGPAMATVTPAPATSTPAPTSTVTPAATSAPQAPPPPSAGVLGISWEDQGNWLDTNGGHNDGVWFTDGTGNPNGVSHWIWSSAGNGKYLVHPANNTGLCLTYNQSVGDLSLESCPGTSNQLWTHPRSGSSNNYQIHLPGYNLNADDPGNPGETDQAIAVSPIGFGYNGQTIYQLTD